MSKPPACKPRAGRGRLVPDYRCADGPPQPESWLTSVWFGVVACGTVLGGVGLLVYKLLDYLLSPIQY